MITFPFEYDGEPYKAEANINNNNGTISCDIPRVLNSKGQSVTIDGSIYIKKTPKGYIPDAVHSLLPITREIAKGLDQYLKDVKLIQYSPAGTEILYVDRVVEFRKQVVVKSSTKPWRTPPVS
jgi:hypothetical protein